MSPHPEEALRVVDQKCDHAGGKAFSTLQALFALKGYELTVQGGDMNQYAVRRWGWAKGFEDECALRAWAVAAGVLD